MLLLVLPRVATLSLTMAIIPQFGFWIILGIAAIVCASCSAYYTIDPQKVFIAAISSLCAPSLLLHDHTQFYYVVNFTSSALLSILSCVLSVLLYYENDLELLSDHIRRPHIFGNASGNQVCWFFNTLINFCEGAFKFYVDKIFGFFHPSLPPLLLFYYSVKFYSWFFKKNFVWV